MRGENEVEVSEAIDKRRNHKVESLRRSYEHSKEPSQYFYDRFMIHLHYLWITLISRDDNQSLLDMEEHIKLHVKEAFEISKFMKSLLRKLG